MLYFLFVFILLVILLILYGIWENTNLKIEKYDIKSDKIKQNTSLVLLTDLHGCHFGTDNEFLYKKIRELNPDFIGIAGDMVVKNGKKNEVALSIICKLAKEFPIYYSPGNHEIRLPDYSEYMYRLRQAGIHYLQNEKEFTSKGISIVGLDLEEEWYHKVWNKRDMKSDVLKDKLGTCSSERFTVLLAHNPEYFMQYSSWGADLTLSGHIHGGIARLPLIGGVLSPSLQLFPKFDAGSFERGGHYMILSRGLGLHHIRLRFFNRPELSYIRLKGKE